MPEKSISIIIPTYNEEQYLGGCLDSIFALDFPIDRIEVILVDNGSTDKTHEIADSYAVKVLRDDKMNVSGLRNIGSKEAEGDILAFVDADCLVSREWLKQASKYFKREEVAAWGAPPELPSEATWVQETWYLIRRKQMPVQNVNWLETMNLFVRKEQFLAIGGFNESLITCEDVDFCYRIRRYGSIISDSSLKVVHLGEASTLKEFIRKEIWRGKSNLTGVRSHGFTLKELPSLSIPIYFGVFLPGCLLGIFLLLSPVWLFFWLGLLLLPSAAVLFKVRKKLVSFMDFFRLLFLVQIYFFSRTVAILKRD